MLTVVAVAVDDNRRENVLLPWENVLGIRQPEDGDREPRWVHVLPLLDQILHAVVQQLDGGWHTLGGNRQ